MIKCVFCFLLLTSCSSVKNNSKKDEGIELNRVWNMVLFKNYSKEALIKKRASLDLTGKDFAPAFMGCNHLTLQYTVSQNNKIRFFKGLTTLMACENMDLETEFSSIIDIIQRYELKGHTLYLYGNHGVEMKFIAQDWD